MIRPSDQEGERTGKNIKHRFAFSPTPQPASVTRTRSFKCTLRIRQGTGLNLPIAASTLANRVHFIRCSRDSGRFSWPFVGRRPIRDKAEALAPRGDGPTTWKHRAGRRNRLPHIQTGGSAFGLINTVLP